MHRVVEVAVISLAQCQGMDRWGWLGAAVV